MWYVCFSCRLPVLIHFAPFSELHATADYVFTISLQDAVIFQLILIAKYFIMMRFRLVRRRNFSAKMWNTNTQISIFDAVLNIFSLHSLVKPLFHFPLLPRPKLVTDLQLVRGMDPNYTHPLFAPNYTHFWNLNFSETIQPNSAWSSLPMCVVLILSMKENETPQVEWFCRKKGKKLRAAHINHSINHPITWECV